MKKYAKNYRKIAVTKAYDLLELKANGRLDADGDYLDDEENKLTYIEEVSDFVKSSINSLLGGDVFKTSIKIRYVNDPEKFNTLHEDGFICIGKEGKKWCVRRDIFLEIYEEVKE
jgi:hypothetical protein